jgi:dnd system-associated protein 4
MPSVYIDAKFASMSQDFVKKHTSIAGKGIFTTNVELMIFASMVGYESAKDWKKHSVKDRGNEIEDSTFVTGLKDGIPYLIALQTMQNGEILRDNPPENEIQIWKLFENYAQLGFSEMEKWIMESPGDTDGVETILNKMKEKAEALISKSGPDPHKVEF